MKYCKNDNCGDVKQANHQGRKDIYYCSKCTRLWRLDYQDPDGMSRVLVDFEGELKELDEDSSPID